MRACRDRFKVTKSAFSCAVAKQKYVVVSIDFFVADKRASDSTVVHVQSRVVEASRCCLPLQACGDEHKATKREFMLCALWKSKWQKKQASSSFAFVVYFVLVSVWLTRTSSPILISAACFSIGSYYDDLARISRSFRSRVRHASPCAKAGTMAQLQPVARANAIGRVRHHVAVANCGAEASLVMARLDDEHAMRCSFGLVASSHPATRPRRKTAVSRYSAICRARRKPPTAPSSAGQEDQGAVQHGQPTTMKTTPKRRRPARDRPPTPRRRPHRRARSV